MYQNKFNIGDKVRVIFETAGVTGREGIVTAIREDEVDVTNSIPGAFYFGVGYEYHYQLKALDNGDSFKCEEKELELIPKTQEELNMELFKEAGRLIDPRPKFQIGDVVMLTGGKRQYVIKESIINLAADGHVVYEVAPLNNEDELYHYMESALEFQYHDKNWESYYTESVRNGLPAWRGKIYNYYMFWNVDRTGDKEKIFLDTRSMKPYENDTVPPTSMKHILESHSIYERINSVLYTSNNKGTNRAELRRIFGLSDKELDTFRNDVCDVILARNQNNMTPGYKKNKKVGENEQYDFTDSQLKFISEIDRLDCKEKDDDEKFKDHYPIKMTNLQIMDAIKEAYSNAKKIGKRKMEPMEDERTGDAVTPTKGKVLYEGESYTYKLIIQFWYNFDMNLIETAYPIRMNNNAKKHGSSPKTESTDISDKEAIQNYLKNKGMNDDAVAGFVGNMVQTSPISESAKPPFQVGNRVRIIDGFGLDGVGVVLEAGERDYEYCEYRVRLDGENADRIYYKKNMELITDAPYLESSGTGPKFRSGDVAYIVDTPYKTNVAIMEAVSQDETSGEYIYKAALTFNGNIHQYRESELSYLYHDSKREIHK